MADRYGWSGSMGVMLASQDYLFDSSTVGCIGHTNGAVSSNIGSHLNPQSD